MAEYIEREALIVHIKNLPTWWADAGGVYGRSMKYPEGMFDCEDIVSSVENAPAADVAPVVHGRWISWIEVDDFIPAPRRHECSVCHDVAQVLVNGVELLSAYCPNCGAKMDGKEDDENG